MYWCSHCDVQLEYWGMLGEYALYVCPRCGYRKEVRIQ